MGRYAWVTLATNDAYSLGALVLAHSLRRVGTKYEMVCMITPGVTTPMREKLATVFSLVQEVNVLDSKDEANLALLARPELGITFTKLHCWRLTQYEKCVFVDADALVVRNCDELFEREELSAAPDVGWPDCFNSGVFVFTPSQQTFASITAFAAAKGSFDGGDQGLLNMYFSDWATKDISKHLPFIYNMCSTATYSYLPAFKQFGEDVRIIHFIGITKPWLQYFDTLTGIVQPPPGSAHLQPLLQLWWNIFCEQVHHQLSSSMAASSRLAHFSYRSESYPSASGSFKHHADVKHDVHHDLPPDFSEFRDPWEDYVDRKNEDVACQTDNDKFQLEYNQQLHYEQSSCDKRFSIPALVQACTTSDQQQYATRNEHAQQHATPHSEDNHEYIAEHVNFSHWQRNNYEQHCEQQQQQHNDEQRHNNCEQPQYQHESCQWQEQRYYHEQHYDKERQLDVPYQQSGYHEDANKSMDYSAQHKSVSQHHERQSHPVVVRYENHPTANDHHQASHQNIERQFWPEYANEGNRAASNENSSAATNEHTTNERRIDSHPPSPAPYSDFHNIAVQTGPTVMRHAGIVGALAQMTLGAARSEQQIALEDHMRKQSWEQGQIDYMGRDSFDNIWKKICETLSKAAQRISPPKEDKPKEESIAAAEPIAEPVVAAVAPQSAPQVDAPVVDTAEISTQEQSLAPKVPEEKLPAQTIPEIGDRNVAQPSEQKAPAEGSVVVAEAIAMKEPSEPIQSKTEDVCAKPTEPKPQSVEPKPQSTEPRRETSAEEEVPSPRPPVESPPMEQCKLASPVMQEEATSQDKTPSAQLISQDSPQVELQASACPMADAVCKLPTQETIASVAQVQDASAPMEDKSQVSAPATADVTQPPVAAVGADASQDLAASVVTSPIADTTKSSAESATDVTQPLTIDPSERHADMLLAASEISTMSPVPIQVAESVLQAEPKESVSGAAPTVSDQAIATTVTAVHEPSVDVAPPATTTESKERAVQLNGSVCDAEKRSDVAAVAPSPPEKIDAPAEPTKEPASVSVATKETLSETAQPASAEKVAEQITTPIAAEPTAVEPTMPIVKTEVKSPEQQTVKTDTTAGGASPEQAAKVETTEAKPAQLTEQATKVQAAGATAAAKPPSEAPQSPVAEKPPPTKPAEAKALNIPSTPTVIEATPPVSPSVESAQEVESQEKAAKKSLKKSDSADGTDGEDKKGGKKTVKKVSKKSKPSKSEEVASATEAAAVATATAPAPAAAAAAVAAAAAPAPAPAPAPTTGDNSQNKSKKTVKVAKKTGAKSGQSLETDTTVPETPPPPATPDVPVPPKRKTKSTAKGSTDKKSEAEE